MDSITFGKRIQELRLAKNLSQRELAKKAEMDYTYLSKIENGKMPAPKEDVIEKLCKLLDADLNELLILAGKVTPALGQTIQRSEAAREFLFRHAPKLSEEDWEEIIRNVEKDSKAK